MKQKKSKLVVALLLPLLTCFAHGIVLAEEDTKQESEQTTSGPLVLPEDETDTGAEKKCLTVCQEWGESCVINPRTGNRKCRRTCKQLGEECI